MRDRIFGVIVGVMGYEIDVRHFHIRGYLSEWYAPYKFYVVFNSESADHLPEFWQNPRSSTPHQEKFYVGYFMNNPVRGLQHRINTSVRTHSADIGNHVIVPVLFFQFG